MRSEIEHGLERHAHACYSPVASVRGRDVGSEHTVPITLITGLGRRARIIRFSLSQVASGDFAARTRRCLQIETV